MNIYDSPRSWPEDYGLENGRYVNTCKTCSLFFAGHKRRVDCKTCAPEQPQPDPLTSAIERMQSVSMDELMQIWWEHPSLSDDTAMEAIRARLIEAAKGGEE